MPTWRNSRTARKDSATIRASARRTPVVPIVVGDAPHLAVACYEVGVFGSGRARREAQDDGTASLVQGFADHSYFFRLVRMVGDAIGLDKVDFPLRVFLGNGVVISLAGGSVGHSVVVIVPGADIVLIGGVGGVEIGTGDCVRRPSLPGGESRG